MIPSVFLVLPLLLPVSEPARRSESERQVDFFAVAPSIRSASSALSAAPLARSGSVIPPLYARQDRGLLVSLSPGSPCTAACLRLQVTF
jgi:hypothetical protein